jgi:L-iditol 2-dehydrogenase
VKVAVAYDVDDIRVEERPNPVPGAGEAVVRVRACGVCSGDALAWYVRRKMPSVLGHEPVGIVEAVGAGVVWPREGDRIFVHHHAPCGTCHLCRRGHTTQCPTWKGSSIDPGGFAELIRVPALNLAGDSLGIPDHVGDGAATMLEPLACCVRAFRKLPLRRGDSVLVIGLGTMGILNVALAKSMGVERIFASDFVPWRRAQATRFGAHAVFDPGAGDVAAMVREATDGLGADHVIVGPGGPKPLAHGIDCAAPGGTVVAFTDSQAGEILELEPSRLYKPEITIAASYSCGPADTREARRLLADEALPLDDMITHHFGLDGVQEAIALTANAGESLKSVCWPGGVPAGATR